MAKIDPVMKRNILIGVGLLFALVIGVSFLMPRDETDEETDFEETDQETEFEETETDQETEQQSELQAEQGSAIIEPEETPTKYVFIGKTEDVAIGYNRIVNLAEVEIFDQQGNKIQVDPNDVSGEPILGDYVNSKKKLVDGSYTTFAHTGDSNLHDGIKDQEKEKQHFKITLSTPTVVSRVNIIDREKGHYGDRLKKVKVQLLSDDDTVHLESPNIPDDLISKGEHMYSFEISDKTWKKLPFDQSATHPLKGYQLITHQAAAGNPIMYGHPGDNKAVAIEDGKKITRDKFWFLEPASKPNTYRMKAVNKGTYMSYVGDGKVWYTTKPDSFYEILFEPVGNDNYVMSRGDEALGKVYFGYNKDGYMQAKNAKDHGNDATKFSNDSIRVMVRPGVERSGEAGWRKKIGEKYVCTNPEKPNVGCNDSSGNGVDWNDDNACPDNSYMYCY